MKNAVVLFLMLFASVSAFGQERKSISLPEAVITAPELMVSVNGNGSGYLNDYLASNIQYPVNALLWNEEGVEVVRFIVTPGGEVTDLAVVNSVSGEIDNEVIRVLNTTNGLWKPSLLNGTPVEREREVSITFTTDVTNPSDRFLRLARKEYVAGNRKFFVRENYKSALYFYDRAVCFVPNDKSALLARGMCKYRLGDKKGACNDWNRVRTLGGVESDSFLDSFCGIDGYAEMVKQVGVN
jgi:hypothetical protein